MPRLFQVVVDCADPHKLAAFWAEALEFEIEDNSEQIKGLLDGGVITGEHVTTVDGRLAWRTGAAIVDPDAPTDPSTGRRPAGRVLFQVVPEPKTVKNRLHLDVFVGDRPREEVVARLIELGARKLWEGSEGPGSTWITMADPEGNEFCVN